MPRLVALVAVLLVPASLVVCGTGFDQQTSDELRHAGPEDCRLLVLDTVPVELLLRGSVARATILGSGASGNVEFRDRKPPGSWSREWALGEGCG